MCFQIALGVILVCNSFGVRVTEVVSSSLFICLGSWLLHRSRKGKIKTVLLFGHHLRGEDAKLVTSIVGIILILIGTLVFVAAVLKLDC